MDIGTLITLVWNELLMRPIINGLVLLYVILFSNFALTIIFFTLVVRLVTLPLTMRQLRVSKAMSELQPQLREIQRRYANNRQKISDETMKLYRQAGVSPLGCAGPMFIQMPIWIALYGAIINLLPTTPEALANLAGYLYNGFDWLLGAIPLQSRFLWLDLGLPDSIGLNTAPPLRGLLLPVLVGGSMWLQQKISPTPTSADSSAQATNQIMTLMMPLMFGYFTLLMPSGLAIYWLTSNLVGIGMQIAVSGWGPVERLLGRKVVAVAPRVSPRASLQEAADAEAGAQAAARAPSRRRTGRGSGRYRGKRKKR